MDDTVVARKLYRDPDQKAIGGVCSGIAKYFNIAVWIPRLIFALPIFFGMFEVPLTLLFFPLAASFSGTMIIIYIILWAVVPKAVTASEKLEMRGEKVDLNTIKHKVQDELKGVKKSFTDNGIIRFIFGLIKVFFFLILGLIAVVLTLVVFAIVMGGAALMPLKDFLVNSEQIQWYAWGVILLFLSVPVIGLVITLVKRIAGIRSRNHYLTYTLVTLWILGWLSVMLLVRSVSNEYRRQGIVRETATVQQPSKGRMKVEFVSAPGKYYPLDLNVGFIIESDIDDNGENHTSDSPLLSITEDSLLISPIKLKIRKSMDDSFHVTLVKRARGSSPAKAEQFAERIPYKISQSDSVLYLPTAFPINTTDKFRNQQLIIEIAVPVGKEIYVSGASEHVNWMEFNGDGKGGISINIDEDDDEPSWRNGVWYIMTENGIEKKFKDPADEGETPSESSEGSGEPEVSASGHKKLLFTAISLLKLSSYIRPNQNP